MNFHRNESEDKVVNYCTTVGVHFEYTNFWDKDEEIFQNAKNMIAFRKRFKQKIAIVGGKGKVVDKLKMQEEDAAKRRKEESHGLGQEAENWLRDEEEEKKKTTEEATKKIEEAKKRKEEEEIQSRQKESEGLTLEDVNKEKEKA